MSGCHPEGLEEEVVGHSGEGEVEGGEPVGEMREEGREREEWEGGERQGLCPG